jgi:hypothetical protein
MTLEQRLRETATRDELQAQAIEQLTEALNALDQARSTLKDLGIQEHDVAYPNRHRLSLDQMYEHTALMIQNLKTWDWEE